MDIEPSLPDSYVNPFVHELTIDNPWEIIKTYVLTILLLPIRVVCICLFLIIAWLIACIGLLGLTPEELQARPITGWRRFLKKILCTLGIWSYLAGGVAIVVKGKQVSRNEAPILVAAPHSSFLDSCIVYVTYLSSVIVRKESMDNYVGKLIDFTQPIYVLREDPNSRQNTIREIVERATSTVDWPQIVIFPEGTCTNRSSLIKFKSGAFYPGVPVQPVLIRYPNKLDSFTWTWDGPGILKLLWITLTRLHSVCEIEYLPVYKPSDLEKTYPNLFALKVRDVMASALHVPVTEYSYDDCIILSKAKRMNIPFARDIVVINKLIENLWFDEDSFDDVLEDTTDNERYMDLHEFSVFLQQYMWNLETRNLFQIMKEEKIGMVRKQKLLLCICFLLHRNHTMIQFLNRVVKIYNYLGYFSSKRLYTLLQHTGEITREDSDKIFANLAEIHSNNVTYPDFTAFADERMLFEEADGRNR